MSTIKARELVDLGGSGSISAEDLVKTKKNKAMFDSLHGVTDRGDYAPLTAYNKDDVVYDAGAVVSTPAKWYKVKEAFTSTNIVSDVASGDLELWQGATKIDTLVNTPFSTVAEMDSSTFLKTGDKVRVNGYYSVGDGGANEYEIVAAGTGVHDGGSYIDLSGSGLQAKAIFPWGAWGQQFGLVSDGGYDFNTQTFSGTNNLTQLSAICSYSVDAKTTVNFGAGDYFVSGTVPFGKGDVFAKIKGAGFGQTNFYSDNAAGTFVFSYVSTVVGQVEGFHFEDMYVLARSALQINEPVAANILSMPAVLNSKFTGNIFDGIDYSGQAVILCKAFDTEICKNRFQSVSVGLHLWASDINNIHTNRITSAKSAHFLETGVDSFGSQNHFHDNDLLNFNDGVSDFPQKAFLVSSGRDVRFNNNYVEQQEALTNNATAIIAVYDNGLVDKISRVEIVGNRTDIDDTNFDWGFDIGFADGSGWYDIATTIIKDNRSLQGVKPTSRLRDNLRYWNGSVYRNVFDIDNMEGWPNTFKTSFNSDYSDISGVTFSIDKAGLSTVYQGVTTEINYDSFVLPPVSSAGHRIEFDPALTEWGNLDGLANGASLAILASSEVEGQELNWELTVSSLGVIASGTITLSTTQKYYVLSSGAGTTGYLNYRASFYNEDTVNAGEAYIKAVKINQAP